MKKKSHSKPKATMTFFFNGQILSCSNRPTSAQVVWKALIWTWFDSLALSEFSSCDCKPTEFRESTSTTVKIRPSSFEMHLEYLHFYRAQGANTNGLVHEPMWESIGELTSSRNDLLNTSCRVRLFQALDYHLHTKVHYDSYR